MPLKRSLVVSILIPLIFGSISGLMTTQSVDTWYKTLTLPAFAPPNWIFAPVWTSLYVFMGLSSYFIYTKKKSTLHRFSLTVYAVQLFLNILWSFLFFGLKSPLLAFVDITFLWFAIILYIVITPAIDRRSAYLFLPYHMWVSFAAILNLTIVFLNPIYR